MIISATLSKPAKSCEEILGRPYQRIKIKAANTANGTAYQLEMFTEKQAFHQQKNQQELESFLEDNAGKTFKNCIIRTDSEEITILSNKKGEIKKISKKIKEVETQEKSGQTFKTEPNGKSTAQSFTQNLKITSDAFNKKKNYLIQEGTPVPFMVLLGIMTAEGRIINSKYDKFRQINRFLEFIDDILPVVTKKLDHPLRIADFGCGKSYLTFAVHYYLTQVKQIPVDIIGLDLKKDVIDYCNNIARQLGLQGLQFDTGNIADYSYSHAPDIVITLHACDTATDYALDYAVRKNCRAILSVPCCQHEINQQLGKKSGKGKNVAARESSAKNSEFLIASNIQEHMDSNSNSHNDAPNSSDPFAPLLKYGLIKERFAALATDALRGEYLEAMGYSVQMLEFIDIENTPKNLMIRAVLNDKAACLKCSGNEINQKKSDSFETYAKRPINRYIKEADALTDALNVRTTLKKLLGL